MTKLIGILNLTPDSFSDGGALPDMATVLRAVEALVAQGAYGIDIGAESTRPGATLLTQKEEWARLEPFFTEVFPRVRERATFSLDTRHAETAARALALGLDWINDVSGLENPAMREAVRGSKCTLVLMHSLSVPADPAHTLPEAADPVAEIISWAKTRIASLEAEGTTRERLVLDPGIGFGKTPAQSWDIIRRVGELRACGLPLLIGHSRKSFLKAAAADRDDATLTISAQLAAQGVEYLRVHNVARHAEMLHGKAAAHGTA